MTPKSATPQQSCLEAAYRCLSYRPRSRFEVKSWLARKGFGSRTIETTLAALEAQGLLDDAAFARFWRESRESFSPRSRAALRRELRQKGVEADVATEAVNGVDEEEAAYRVGQKKATKLRPIGYDDFKKKLNAVLKMRGFSYAVIEHTVNRLWQESVKDA